jgi:hypothetical protein
MSSHPITNQDELQALIAERWGDTWKSLGVMVEGAEVTWAVGESEHFRSARGFATTSYYGGSRCHLKFAEKALALPRPKLDAILRHEIGHVVDFITPPDQLNSHLLDLPSTRERRADAIALHIWGSPIYYGADLVQTTQEGLTPRPKTLGL